MADWRIVAQKSADTWPAQVQQWIAKPFARNVRARRRSATARCRCLNLHENEGRVHSTAPPIGRAARRCSAACILPCRRPIARHCCFAACGGTPPAPEESKELQRVLFAFVYHPVEVFADVLERLLQRIVGESSVNP